MNKITIALAIFASFPALAQHGGRKSSAGKSSSVSSSDTTPFFEMTKDPAKFEKAKRSITKELSGVLGTDIELMKSKRKQDASKEDLAALECLQKNMDRYVDAANGAGPTLMNDQPNANVTPAQMRAVFKTISNTIRYNHNYDE